MQQDQSLMTALKRRCAAAKVSLSGAFHVDPAQFFDMQKQMRKQICAENVMRMDTQARQAAPYCDERYL